VLGAVVNVVYVGIDGGMSGALAFYVPDAYLRVYSVPHIDRKVRGKSRSDVNPTALRALLAVELAGADALGFVETGVGDRRQSAPAAYTYGFTNGAVWMALCERMEEVNMVHASVWKRHYGLIGKDKEASRNKALKLFPGLHQFDKKSDHNKAEAALIALYGYQIRNA
jgi:crossover junction endodeoxyribonuclease RuvC